MTDSSQRFIADVFAAQKTSHGTCAGSVWLGSCLFLFASGGGLRSLGTMKAVVLCIVGTLLAALLLGALGYLVHRVVVRGLTPLIRMLPSPSIPPVMRRIGVVVFVIDAVVSFFIARLAYNAW